MKLERELMKQVYRRLELYRMTGEVVNFHRLNAGKINNLFTNSWVQLGEKDTPDFIAILRNKENGLTVLYVECKSDTGRLTAGQKSFQQKYNKKDVYCITLVDIYYLDKFIAELAIDPTKDMKKWTP